MKVLVVIFALCLVGTLGGLTDEQKAKLKDHKEFCIRETGVDPAVVENAKKGEIANGDEKLQCFTACLLKKIGIMDAEGKLHEEVVRAKAPADVPKEKLNDIINHCKVLNGSNDCETGAAVFTCFLLTKTFNIL